MSLVSYAQNAEDIVLWRALKKIQSGFYIDIGAAWPEYHSVTNLFYKADWTGINVEPNPKLFQKLSQARPKDKNLFCLVSDTKKENADFFVFEDTGLSTSIRNISEQQAKKGLTQTQIQIAQTTLKDICEHYTQGKDIHFLKVDVEGAEQQVLQGNDWAKYRPWIVVVEAMAPSSTKETHAEWEPVLLSNNYHFIYADGLNRFYVAQEKMDLKQHFAYPPNIFDDYTSDEVILLKNEIAELRLGKYKAETELDYTRSILKQIEHKANSLATTLHEEQEKYKYLTNSRSWKVTKPLRALGDLVKKIKTKKSARI